MGKGCGGLYKAPKEKERRMRKTKRRRGERDQIKFIDLIFERWHVVGCMKQEEGKALHKLHVLGMNEDLLDGVRGVHAIKESFLIFTCDY